MKRYGNLFEKIIALENLYAAYRAARKGKTWQDTVKHFDNHYEENLANIRESLINKTFTTSSYKEKTIYEPKKRTIYKLPFNPDRVVQHALMRVLEPIWDNLFIHDSYACRKGKGIHAGSRRTMEFVRRNKYCLKCDVSKFYQSVNHDVIFDIVQRKIKCKDTLLLLQDIIYSYPGASNVPIGNYTSQWLGNLYLNELDQLIKQQFRIKDYIRYCDDFLLFSDDKYFLGKMAVIIEVYLRDYLKLKLSKCDLFPVSRGVDFLGYRHFKGYILIRKSTAKRVKRRLKILPIMLQKGIITMEQYRSSLAATNGWLKWANSYNLKKSLHVEEMIAACQ